MVGVRVRLWVGVWVMDRARDVRIGFVYRDTHVSNGWG